MTIAVGILTVSDGCSRGLREDASGAALRRIVERMGWKVGESRVVPDEAGEIERVLLDWCDVKRLSIVLTTGGTGLGPRDVTPEATRRVLEKELPGVAELMRREGLSHTPMAALSRAIAGTRGKSVVINLPGSPAGAEQSFKAVLHLVPHAIEVLAGAGHDRPAGRGRHAHAHGRRAKGSGRP